MEEAKRPISDSPALRSFLESEGGTRLLDEEGYRTLVGRMDRLEFAPGQKIVVEGEPADSLYVIDRGSAEVFKESEGGKRIGTLGSGDVFGELALFTGSPRAATVAASTEMSLFRLRKGDFEELTNSRPQIGGAFLTKLYARLRDSYRSLEESESKLRVAYKMRTELASVFTNVVLVITAYTFLLGLLYSDAAASLAFIVQNKGIISRVVELACLLVIIGMVRNSGQPLSSFGVTLEGWKRSLVDSLGATSIIVALLVAAKLVLLRTAPRLFEESTLFSMRYFDASYVSYILVAPLQEFIARGAMQGSLQRLLVGKRANFWAVVVTSFLFGSLHLYESAGLSATALITSLIWGWMYSRQKSLVGVGLSHFIVGNCAGLLGIWSLL